MGWFGFSSKKEVEEKERLAREEARQAALKDMKERERKIRQETLQDQQKNLSSLAKGSQIKITVPYFDVFDPQYENFAVPVAVHGMLVYAINDISLFNSINKTQNINDDVFQQKLKGQVTKFVKSVVTNAPVDNNIHVLQLERKILEISELVQNKVTPQIEKLFGVNVRSIDITDINVDKTSMGYRDLKMVTTNLDIESLQARTHLNINGQEELQKMQLEHQRESMRIQREELQRNARLQTETNFLSAHQADLNAKVQIAQAQGGLLRGGMFGSITAIQNLEGIPQMPVAEPQVQYMVGINGQQAGPFAWNQLQQLVQQGKLTQQTYVWKQGMPQWQFAGQILELQPLFVI